MDAFLALCGPGSPSAADQAVSRSTSDARDPAQMRPEERGLGAELIVRAVGQRQRHARLRAQRELVGVVALDGPVPVEMIGGQGGHRDHLGRTPQIGDLEARCLDDPEVGLRLRRRVPGRLPDVPARPGAVAELGQEVHGQRRRGALALRAGDAGDAGRIRLLHEQAEPAADGHAGRLELRHLGSVAADAGALHHHVAAQERVQAPANPWPGPRARRGRARPARRRPGSACGPWTASAGCWPCPRRPAPRRRRTRQRARTRRSAGA